MIKIIKGLFLFATSLSGVALLIAGLNDYPGSKLIYILFSVMFWAMLLTAFGKRTHHGYLFLAITLWLGYWVKITAHMILKYPYVEPIGNFDSSADAWDSALWVAIFASAGVMLGKLFFALMGKKYNRVADVDCARVPVWYPVIRRWIWPLTLAMIMGIAVINMILGIQQIGLVPRTILPWPLNALIAWQVSMGSALLITVLLWWEVALKKNISVSIYTLLIEAITSTATLLSRGVYIFHTIPQLFALYENRQWLVGLSRAKVAALLLAFAGLLVVSIAGVTTFRAYLYPHEGGFTTEEQGRMTRLEVIEGGIARVKTLIAQGEPQEGHLRELLAEKTQIEDQRRLARLEVLEGGIARVKKLISQGQPQEGHLQELLAEKAQLENDLSKNEATQESNFRSSLAEIEDQRRLARLEVLEGGIAHVKKLIFQGQPQEGHLRELLAEKAQLEKGLSRSGAKNDVVVAGYKWDKVKSVINSDSDRDKLPRNKAEEQLREFHVEKAQLDSGRLNGEVESGAVVTGDRLDKAQSAASPDFNRNALLENKDKLLSELYSQISTGALSRIVSLVVDRWVGLEGVMAVSAYPEKSNALLFEAAKEKREIGKATRFQYICNSHYRWADANNWQFASLPGAAAFLYFSGSLWVVIIGMALFSILLQLGEQLVFTLTYNPLLCSLFGLTLANSITQFGITPRQDIPFYSLILAFVLLVSIVQSDRIYNILRKYGFHRGYRGAV